MKKLLVLCLAASGCQLLGFGSKFIQTDPSYRPKQGDYAPAVLLDVKEVEKAPAFHIVGLLETRGSVGQPLERFLTELERAGNVLGCDLLVQRGVFENRAGAFAAPITDFRVWRSSGVATWQFFCGVTGEAEDDQAQRSAEAAQLAAEKEARQERGPECSYAPLVGSHIDVYRCNFEGGSSTQDR
jgi:hypothetical protein